MQGLGMSAHRVGTAIYLEGNNPLALDIADPCSGIRSLIAICALSVGYSYFLPCKPWKKITLWIAAIPIVVALELGHAADLEPLQIQVQFFREIEPLNLTEQAVVVLGPDVKVKPHVHAFAGHRREPLYPGLVETA